MQPTPHHRWPEFEPLARRMIRFRIDDPSLAADLDATAKALLELVAA